MVAAQDGRNVWVLPGPRQPRPTHIRMRLICFPMAGSGACMYHDWAFAEELGVEVGGGEGHNCLLLARAAEGTAQFPGSRNII